MSPPLRSPHVSIRASAGAGKTYQLSTRYLALLARGERAERILATTFTRKAAAEIAERVLLRLARAARDPRSCERLAQEIGSTGERAPELSLARVRGLLAELLEALPRWKISTLDSFFQTAARTESFALGLAPGWRLADEGEDAELREEAARATLAESGGGAAELLTSLLGVADEAFLHVGDRLARLVRELFAAHRELSGRAWNLLGDAPAPSETELAEALRPLEELPIPRTKSGTPNKNWERALPAALAAAREEDWIAFATNGIVKKVWEGDTVFSLVEIPAAVSEAIQELGVLARRRLLARHAERMRRLRAFLDAFAGRYAELARARGSTTFEDLTARLGRAAELGLGEELWFRLDARIGHLLLDEFQDTSLAQWRVLQPLAEEILATGDGSRSFFCVGDVKQAIYGWRGGLAALFDRLEEDHGQSLAREDLSASYRSAPAVIEIVNRLFTDAAANAVLDPAIHRPAAERWGRGFSTHVAAKLDLGGEVRLHVLPGPLEREARSSGAARTAPTIDRCIELAREALRDHPGATIGILVRRNGSIPTLLAALRAALDVPISAEGGNPLTDSPAVESVLALLSLVDHPGDTRHRYHVASTPLGASFGLTEWNDHAQASHVAQGLREALGRAGLAAFVARCVRELAPHLGARDLSRAQQLVRLTCAFEQRAPFARPGELVRAIERARVEDRVEAQVRVMTVHQAKGLEFDVVILPELEQRLEGQRPPTWHQRTDPREAALGLGVCQHFRKELLPLLPKLEQLERERKQAQVAESLCVLYVAVTRARHALHLVLGPEAKPEKEPSPTAGGFVRAALGCAGPLTEPEVRGLSGAPGWSLAPREERAPAPELALDLALAPPRRARAPRRAPSSEEGAGRLDLAQLLRVESGVALRRGRAWHALFERVGFLEDGEPEEQDLRSALLRRGEAPSEIDALVTAFRAALRSPLVLQALSRAAFAPESDLVLLREEPFAVRVGAELWTGSFDRLVLVRRAGRVASAHVLDFKTDRLPPGDEAAFEARTRFYAPQLEGYRRAASALFALPPDAVSAALLFPFAGRLWRLEERSG